MGNRDHRPPQRPPAMSTGRHARVELWPDAATASADGPVAGPPSLLPVRVVICTCGTIAGAALRLERDRRFAVLAQSRGLPAPADIARSEPDLVVIDEPSDERRLAGFATVGRALEPWALVLVTSSSDALVARSNQVEGIDAALLTSAQPSLADRIVELLW